MLANASQVPAVSPSGGTVQWVAPVNASGNSFTMTAPAACPSGTSFSFAWLVNPGAEDTIGNSANLTAATTVAQFTTNGAVTDGQAPSVTAAWAGIRNGLAARVPASEAGSPSGTVVLDQTYSLGMDCQVADPPPGTPPLAIWYTQVQITAITTNAWPAGTAAVSAPIGWTWSIVAGSGGAVTPAAPPTTAPPTTAPPTTAPPTTAPPTTAPPTTPPPTTAPPTTPPASNPPPPTGNADQGGNLPKNPPGSGTSGGTGGGTGAGAGSGHALGIAAGLGAGAGTGGGTGAASNAAAVAGAEVTFAGPTGAALGTDPTLTPGERVTISAKGFSGSEKVAVVIHSTPANLGSFPASKGTLTAKITIPAALPDGNHTIALTGATSHVTKIAPFRIGAAAAAGSTGGGTGSGAIGNGQLTGAGFDVTSPIAIAVYVVGLGIAVLALTAWNREGGTGRWRRFLRLPGLRPRRGNP
jgi:hypothetical protein